MFAWCPRHSRGGSGRRGSLGSSGRDAAGSGRAIGRTVAWLTVMLVAGSALAQGTEGAAAAGGPYLAAALATGLAAIGAGIAVGIAGAAAIGAISEKPELLGRTLIFVGLAEGIVIYGLIVSFILLGAG